MIVHSDSGTGREIDGKAYILSTTEGSELIDPRRLFPEQGSGDDVAADLDQINDRLRTLEETCAELLRRTDTPNVAPEPAPKAARAPRQRKGGQ